MVMRNPIMQKIARDFMTPRVITASRETNGQVLARQLLSGLFSGLPVIDPNGEVVGVVTEFDLLKAFREGKDLQFIKAEDIMTVPPLCIHEDTTLEVTIQKMIEHRVTRLPVVRNQRIVGVVSRANILAQLVDAGFQTQHVVALCYWCEKVQEEPDSHIGDGIWCDLDAYLERHHLFSQDLSFMHTFCPTCAPQVKKLMGGKYTGPSES